MDEPASALDPIATTRIEDLMHELKNDYTIVVVTHNMQQAARVADMTAFFSVERRRGGPAHRHPRRVRRDDEDLHPALRQADGGLRHRAVRLMRVGLQEELDTLQAALDGGGRARPALAARCAGGAARPARPELADEVIAFDDEVDARYLAIEAGIESLLARQTPVAGDLRLVLAMPPRQPPPRADGRLLRDDRQADEARLRDRRRTAKLIEAFEEMGSRAEEMIRVALDSFRSRDLAGAESLVELDELIDRANRRAVQHVLALGSNPELREWGCA